MMIYKNVKLIAFIILSTTLITCNKINEPLQIYSDKSIILIDDLSNFDFESIQINDFSINDVRIDKTEDYIIFKVTYAGGCNEHQFKLYGTHGILYSNPPGCYVYLSHNGNKDYCEAMISETLSFSLKPYINAGYDAVILHLRGYKEEDLGTIWYRK